MPLRLPVWRRPLLRVKTSFTFLLIRSLQLGLKSHLLLTTPQSLSPALLSLTSLSLWLFPFYRRLLVISSRRVLQMTLSLLDYLKRFSPTVGPSVISVINSSLSSGVVPENFKHAVVIVIVIFNDIFLATDSGDCVILVLLDLTAAFDTVDHEILISHLKQWVGIRGVALDWFRSYLADWTFSVNLGDPVSTSAPLWCRVPQGSVLAPLLFSFCSHLVPYLGNTAFHSTGMQTKGRIMCLLKRKMNTLSDWYLSVLTT